MLSDVPSGLQISEKNVIRKYIRHALYCFLLVNDLYLLLIFCIMFVSLYRSGAKVNSSRMFSLMRWCCKSWIRLFNQILVTYDVSSFIFSRIEVVNRAASW